MNRPVITLTTDFGTRDSYVGAMKGVLVSRSPDANVVDGQLRLTLLQATT